MGARGVVVVGVVDLEAREPGRGQRLDDVVVDEAPSPPGAGVREHRDASGRRDQADRPRTGSVAWCVA